HAGLVIQYKQKTVSGMTWFLFDFHVAYLLLRRLVMIDVVYS
ncbi:MAG: hypothetical protein ACJA2B_001713, partial [Candidatus Endobugula sp.]